MVIKSNLQKQTYWVGIGWFVLSLLISNANDVIAKLFTQSWQYTPELIMFLRFLFAVITLLPLMLFKGGVVAFKTSRVGLHIVRGVLLFLAMSAWIYGISIVPIAVATLTTFIIPLIVLVLAAIFLNEKVSPLLQVATLIGFIGVIISYYPSINAIGYEVCILLGAVIIFAILDVINKKFISQEPIWTMIFYSNFVTMILSLQLVYAENLSSIALIDWVLIGAMGIGSNLILFCLLKAFTSVQASDVAPYRYLELIISGFVGFWLFNEVPDSNFLIGALLIIAATLYLAYSNTKTSVAK